MGNYALTKLEVWKSMMIFCNCAQHYFCQVYPEMQLTRESSLEISHVKHSSSSSETKLWSAPQGIASVILNCKIYTSFVLSEVVWVGEVWLWSWAVLSHRLGLVCTLGGSPREKASIQRLPSQQQTVLCRTKVFPVSLNYSILQIGKA